MPPRENFLYSWKMELFYSNILFLLSSLSPQNFSLNTFLIFFPKKSNCNSFLIFSRKSLSYILGKLEKISRGNFRARKFLLYFGKWSFLAKRLETFLEIFAKFIRKHLICSIFLKLY